MRVGLFWYGFRLVRLVIIMNFITKIKQKNRGYTVDLVYIYIYMNQHKIQLTILLTVYKYEDVD